MVLHITVLMFVQMLQLRLLKVLMELKFFLKNINFLLFKKKCLTSCASDINTKQSSSGNLCVSACDYTEYDDSG